jgi:hypothetical protein
MRDEDLLYKELADVPPVPPKAFAQIERKIKAAAIKKQMTFTMVAAIILSLAGSSWFLSKQTLNADISVRTTPTVVPTVVPTDVAYELQIARDFINGDDLNNDTEQYALLDSSDF